MKKLNEQQIQQIFDFTRKHYVEHYDVQVELVDHLANAIETQWAENPNVSFEEALSIEFKKFGVFGFMGLVEQKQAALQNHYNKMLWNEILKFVSIPKALITAVLYVLIFILLKYSKELGEIIALSLLLLSFVYYLFDSKVILTFFDKSKGLRKFVLRNIKPQPSVPSTEQRYDRIRNSSLFTSDKKRI